MRKGCRLGIAIETYARTFFIVITLSIGGVSFLAGQFTFVTW